MNSLAFLHLSPGVGEVLLILIAALLFFGADELPGIARSMGRFLNQMRHAADDFNDQLLDADRYRPGSASSDPDASDHPDGVGARRGKNTGAQATDSCRPSAAPDRGPSGSDNGTS